jgi:hypothetical protein
MQFWIKLYCKVFSYDDYDYDDNIYGLTEQRSEKLRSQH